MATMVGAPPGVVASHIKTTPLPIPAVGLVGWWDADDASTFTYSSGTEVSDWRDKSGNNRTLTQSNTALQPNRSGTQYGRAAITYANGDFLVRTLAMVADNITVFIASKTPYGVGPRVLLHNGSAQNDGFGLAACANSDQVGLLRGGLAWVPTSTQNPWIPCVLTWCRNVGTWSLHLNGTATNLNDAGTVRAPAQRLTVPSDTHSWAGDMYEIIYYDRVLTTPERQQVEAYLTAKWIPAPPPFPTTGLQGWYDAADDASFTYQNAPQIATWKDKSGNNRHLAQGTTASQPARNGTINGKTTVTFNGTTQSIRTPATAMAKPHTFVIVAKNTATSGQRDAFMISNDGRVFRTSGGTIDAYQGAFLSSGIQWGTTAAHTVMVEFNGPASKIGVDGGAYTVGDAGSVVADVGFWTVGASTGGASEYWQGDIAEVIVYNRALTAAERSDVEAYLSTKWGTPWTPASLTGLLGWFDASDTTTITASGGKVSEWRDKSGNGRHVSHPDPAYHPQTGVATINGRNVLTFDWATSGDGLYSATMPADSAPSTMFVVQRSSDPTGYHRGPSYFDCIGIMNGKWAMFGYPDHQLNSTVTVDTLPHLLSCEGARGTGPNRLWVDGGTPASRSAVATTIPAPTMKFGEPNIAYTWAGDIAEAIVINRLLSANELARVQSYLKTKWGTP